MDYPPDIFQRHKLVGDYLLYAALTGFVSIILYIAWNFAEGIIYFPVVILGLVAFAILFSNPRLNLIVVLLGFVSLTDYNKGFQNHRSHLRAVFRHLPGPLVSITRIHHPRTLCPYTNRPGRSPSADCCYLLYPRRSHL